MKYSLTSTITYTGKGKPHSELSEIVVGLCHDEWEVSPRSLRKAKGESLEAACVRYVRRQFEQATKQSGYELDTKPFKVEIGMVIEDVTDEEEAKGVGFGITLGRRPR